MIPGVAQRRQFKHLSEQEVLALAISSEEDDARIYRWYAQRLRADYPQSAQVFDEMAYEEDAHGASLIEAHRRRFGEAIPLIRREHVAGFDDRRPVWLVQNLGLDRIRKEVTRMEADARDFYQRAAQRTSDAGTRQLLNRLAADGIRTRGALAKPPAGTSAASGESAAEDAEGPSAIRPHLGAARPRRTDGNGLDRPSPRFSPRHLPPATRGRHFWSAWPRPSARASRWGSPKPPLTTAPSPAAARL